MTLPAIYSSDALNAASDANYSVDSDPYDGTPVKVTPMHAITTQGVRPKKQSAAQFRNWLDNQFAQLHSQEIVDITTLFQYAQELPARSVADNPNVYLAAGIDTVSGGCSAGCWDDGTGAWFVASMTNNGVVAPKIYWSHDDGATFQDISASGYGRGNAGELTKSLAADGAGNCYAVYKNGANSGAIGYYWDGSTWTNPISTSTPQFSNVNPTGFWDSVNHQFVYFSAPQFGTGILWNGAFVWQATATVNFPNQQGFLGTPTGFANINRCIVARKLLTQEALWFPATQTSTGCPDYVHLSDFGLIDTGGTGQPGATLRTLPAGIIATSFVYGLAWNEDQQLWMVGYDNGAATHYATSSDGLTWTACAGTTPFRLIYSGLTAVGKLWVARAPGGIFTSNDNGATWRRSKSGYVGAESNEVIFLSTPHGSQLLYVGDVVVRGSHVAQILETPPVL